MKFYGSMFQKLKLGVGNRGGRWVLKTQAELQAVAIRNERQ